jgi:amino acid permease
MSIQYLGIGLGCVFLPLFNLKSIDKVLVLARYGVIALVGYFLELLAMFITSVAQRGLDFGAVRLWAADADGWIKIAGQFSLAFISHNTIVAVTRDNKSQKEKPRAIAYGYAFAGVLYMLLGVFGGLAIQNYDYF